MKTLVQATPVLPGRWDLTDGTQEDFDFLVLRPPTGILEEAEAPPKSSERSSAGCLRAPEASGI